MQIGEYTKEDLLANVAYLVLEGRVKTRYFKLIEKEYLESI